MSHGIIIWHGSHQVAQKSTITTLPFRSASVTVRPSRSFSTNAGAAAPILMGDGPSAAEVVGLPSLITLARSESCLIQTTASATAQARIPMVRMREPVETGVGCASRGVSGEGGASGTACSPTLGSVDSSMCVAKLLKLYSIAPALLEAI